MEKHDTQYTRNYKENYTLSKSKIKFYNGIYSKTTDCQWNKIYNTFTAMFKSLITTQVVRGPPLSILYLFDDFHPVWILDINSYTLKIKIYMLKWYQKVFSLLLTVQQGSHSYDRFSSKNKCIFLPKKHLNHLYWFYLQFRYVTL